MCFSWIYTVETDQSEQNLTTAAGVWKVATAQRNTLEQVLYGTISAWPGTLPLLRKLKAMKVPMAIATSSPRSLSWLGGMLWVEFVGEIGTISQFLETLPQKVRDTRKYRKWEADVLAVYLQGSCGNPTEDFTPCGGQMCFVPFVSMETVYTSSRYLRPDPASVEGISGQCYWLVAHNFWGTTDASTWPLSHWAMSTHFTWFCQNVAWQAILQSKDAVSQGRLRIRSYLQAYVCFFLNEGRVST